MAFFSLTDSLTDKIESPLKTWLGRSLHEATKKGDVDFLRTAIQRHPEQLNSVNKDQETCLHLACFHQQLKALQYLLTFPNVLVNMRNKNQQTPLHLACTNGFFQGVHLLLCHPEIQCHAWNLRHETPLHLAVLHNQVACVEMFLMNHIQTKGPYLLTPNLNVPDMRQETPLHIAAQKGHGQCIQALLNVPSDIDLNPVNEKQETPLHQAIVQGHPQCAIKLIHHRADIHLVNQYNETPLYLACISGYVDLVILLLEQKANVHIKDQNGQGILQAMVCRRPSYYVQPVALTFEKCQICYYLIQAGALQFYIQQEMKSSDETEKGSETWHLEEDPSIRNEIIRQWIIGWKAQYASNQPLSPITQDMLTWKPKQIQSYFQKANLSLLDEAILSNSSSYQKRLKICVLGPQGWGKTSLIKSFLSEQPIVESRSKEKEMNLNVYDWTFQDQQNCYQVTYWDWTVNSFSTSTTSMFPCLYYSISTFYLYVIDMTWYQDILKFSSKNKNLAMEEKIFQPLRHLLTYIPQATIGFLFTKRDGLNSTTSFDTIRMDFQLMMKNFEKYQLTNQQHPKFHLSTNQLYGISCQMPLYNLKTWKNYFQRFLCRQMQNINPFPSHYVEIFNQFKSQPTKLSISNPSLKFWTVEQWTKEFESAFDKNCENSFSPKEQALDILEALHEVGDICWLGRLFPLSSGMNLPSFLQDLIICSPIHILPYLSEMMHPQWFQSNFLKKWMEKHSMYHPIEQSNILQCLQHHGRFKHSFFMSLKHWKSFEQNPEKELVEVTDPMEMESSSDQFHPISLLKTLLYILKWAYPFPFSILSSNQPRKSSLSSISSLASTRSSFSSSSSTCSSLFFGSIEFPCITYDMDMVVPVFWKDFSSSSFTYEKMKETMCWKYVFSSKLPNWFFEFLCVSFQNPSYQQYYQEHRFLSNVNGLHPYSVEFLMEFQSLSAEKSCLFPTFSMEITSNERSFTSLMFQMHGIQLEKLLKHYFSTHSIDRYVYTSSKFDSNQSEEKKYQGMPLQDIIHGLLQSPSVDHSEEDEFCTLASLKWYGELYDLPELLNSPLVSPRSSIISISTSSPPQTHEFSMFSGLWTISYFHSTQWRQRPIVSIEFRSELSGECDHVPIVLELPNAFLQRFPTIPLIKGLNLFSRSILNWTHLYALNNTIQKIGLLKGSIQWFSYTCPSEISSSSSTCSPNPWIQWHQKISFVEFSRFSFELFQFIAQKHASKSCLHMKNFRSRSNFKGGKIPPWMSIKWKKDQLDQIYCPECILRCLYDTFQLICIQNPYTQAYGWIFQKEMHPSFHSIYPASISTSIP